MEPLGWVMMIVSIGTVLCMVTFCLIKVMSLPEVEMDEIKGPLEIDTQDTTDAD